MNDRPHSSSKRRPLRKALKQRSNARTIPNTPIPSSSFPSACDRDDTVLLHLEQHRPPCPSNISNSHLSVAKTTTVSATQRSQGVADSLSGRNIPDYPQAFTAQTTASAVILASPPPAMFPDELRQDDLALRVDTYDAELGFLQDQWISICITLSSLRHSYIAILVDRDDSFNAATFSSHADFPVPENVSVSTFRVKPNASPPGFTEVHPPSRRWSAIAPNSIEPDIDHEMLLALDEILVQIRQMETNMERLERDIQNTIRPLLRYISDR